MDQLLRRKVSSLKVSYVDIEFPDSAFADAPQWSPGPGFKVCHNNTSWVRDNRNETWTVVGVAYDQSREEEVVFTVDTTDPSHIDDKPHRYLNWDELICGRRIAESYEGHPVQSIREYWDRKGIRPTILPRGGYGIRVKIRRGEGVREIVKVCRRYGARFRIVNPWPWTPSHEIWELKQSC